MALQWPPVLFLEVTLVIEESEASSCASDVRCAVTEGDLAMMMGMLPGGSGGNQSAADVDDPASRMAVSVADAYNTTVVVVGPLDQPPTAPPPAPLVDNGVASGGGGGGTLGGAIGGALAAAALLTVGAVLYVRRNGSGAESEQHAGAEAEPGKPAPLPQLPVTAGDESLAPAAERGQADEAGPSTVSDAAFNMFAIKSAACQLLAGAVLAQPRGRRCSTGAEVHVPWLPAPPRAAIALSDAHL